MGPAKYRGIGWDSQGRGGNNAPPVAPGNGSGGAGSIGLFSGSANFSPAKGEISDAMAGRITLGAVNLAILALIGFYLYTRGMQAGA